MRKTTLAAFLFLLCAVLVSAQGPVIWLPMTVKGCQSPEGWDEMGDWKLVVPEATTNYCLNPSAETTGNFASLGGGTNARSSTYQWYGLYSYRVQTAADNDGGSWTLSALANAIHYVTLLVRGTVPTWDWSLDGATYNNPSLLQTFDDDWSLYGYQFPAAQANASTTLEVRQNGAGAGDFYIDGVQVEQKEYWTTYADGDQEGCAWNGAEHAATSTRSSASTAGGRVKDLKDDYSFGVERHMGTGTVPRSVTVDEYAALPGGEVQNVKIHPRVFTLVGPVIGTGASCDLLQTKEDLESVIASDPVILRYTGRTVQKEIACIYEGGMEGSISAENRIHEKIAPRFIAADPYWYGPGGSGENGAGAAALLDTNDSATMNLIAARLRSTGQWDVLGPPSFGVALSVLAIAIGPEDGKIYFGGQFTNCDGIAAADYIAVYDPVADSFASLGGGLDNIVYALAFGPDGILYAGGSFTNAGGDANADYLAQIDPMAGVPAWSNVGGGPGAGTVSRVEALLFDKDANLYVGGNFTNWDGDANADYITMWDGSSWSALSTGADAMIHDLALDKNGTTVYAGGEFANIGGVATNDVAAWDGSSWSKLGDGGTDAGVVYALAVDSRNILYAGGTFGAVSGITASKIAQYNGTAWAPLGSGVDTGVSVYTIEVGADNRLWVSGNFSEIGGVGVDEFAKWNGASWAHVDIIPPATQIDAVALGNADPVVQQNYDIWIGGSSGTGTAYYSGSTTITNNGTEDVYPVIIFERSGGTSATIYQVRNETTGKELLFDYALLDGERLTIDLRPTQQSVVSDFFGSRPDAILANSNVGDFVLKPGENLITAFVNIAGGPTVTAWMEWRVKYKGL